MRGTVATFARFSSFGGAPLDHLPPLLREAAAAMRSHYDMREHTRVGGAHSREIEDAFVD